MRFRTGAFLPGPPGISDSGWVTVPATAICVDDIAQWPYTPGLVVKWVAFLGTLHWPAGSADLGVGGISYVELLILYELWAGERLSRLVLVTSAQDAQFQCRLFRLVQALIFGVHVVCMGDLPGLSPAPLVLITAGCVKLGGKSVVMVLLLGLVTVPLSLFKMSFWGSFSILLVLLALLTKVPLGGYLHLVMLLVWSLLLLVLGWSLLIVLLMRFLGLVVLVREGREFD